MITKLPYRDHTELGYEVIRVPKMPVDKRAKFIFKKYKNTLMVIESKISNTSLEKIASKYYTNLPYHNFNHAKRAARIGRRISLHCLQEGISINPQIVYLALLFHDAGYQENPWDYGFKNKEEYAAFLAGNALTKMGLEPVIITRIKNAIISTNSSKPFKTNEEKAVRAADLAEIAGNFKQFLQNNKLLKEETEMLAKKSISKKVWKEMTKKTIEFYLSQDIRLTRFYADKTGQSIFHQKARKNLKKFIKN